MFTCRISGLNVSAEMDLPGVIRVAVPAGQEDVRIRRRPVPERLEEATTRGPIWELDRTHFLLRLPGIGRLLATDGRELDVDPAVGTDPADALPFLLGTGFGAVALQRGSFLLHGSAVAFDGRTYVFCGPSGIGKSTLAAALCQAGGHFVNDDVCLIDTDSTGAPIVSSDGRRLKLFEESISWLNLAGQRRGAVRNGIEKFYVEPVACQTDRFLPIGAIHILEDETLPGEVGLVRLSQLDAAQGLLNVSYRPRLALAMNQSSRQLAMTTILVSRVPIFQLTRARSLEHLEETVTMLLTHVRNLSGGDIEREARAR